jgi:pseudaminic acid biosynthesis-associated methylase
MLVRQKGDARMGLEPERDQPEVVRLEQLWEGEFGDAYVDRNRVLDPRRATFWHRLLADFPIQSVLEIGCGQGGNLKPISEAPAAPGVWGVDVNASTLARIRANVPEVNAIKAVARDLPFRDRWFDLVFTMGVLIHQPDETLPLVMNEIVRCSRRYVLWGEYFAEQRTVVPYRGEDGALLKRDYGRIYHELFPELVVRAEGYLAPEDGFDRTTWQLLEKP